MPERGPASLRRLATSWLEGFDHDPRRVVYERLYRLIQRRNARGGRGRRLLDVGAGYGNSLLLFADMPWQFTAIEMFPTIALRLRRRLAEHGMVVDIFEGDVLSFWQRWLGSGGRRFDLVLMVLTSQYMPPEYLARVLRHLSYWTSGKLVLDVTNSRSLYGWWTSSRGWQSDAAYYYTPEQIEEMLEKAGFVVKHRKGVGFLSPLSLFKGWRGMLVRPWMTWCTAFLDALFPRMCHLYYLECEVKD